MKAQTGAGVVALIVAWLVMSLRNCATSESASSRYGTPSSRAFGKDRVVFVGDVADHADVVAELLQPPDQQVVGEVGGRVAEVDESYGACPRRTCGRSGGDRRDDCRVP